MKLHKRLFTLAFSFSLNWTLQLFCPGNHSRLRDATNGSGTSYLPCLLSYLQIKPYTALITTPSFKQRHRLIAGHLELHTMARRDIERKHLRIDLRRANRFVAHQALQNLQWYAGIQHVHRVGVTERMGGHRY